MAGTITLNIDGKDVKVRWNGANPPTLADVSDIEAEWRKQNAPKPKQTTAFQGAKASAKVPRSTAAPQQRQTVPMPPQTGVPGLMQRIQQGTTTQGVEDAVSIFREENRKNPAVTQAFGKIPTADEVLQGRKAGESAGQYASRKSEEFTDKIANSAEFTALYNLFGRPTAGGLNVIGDQLVKSGVLTPEQAKALDGKRLAAGVVASPYDASLDIGVLLSQRATAQEKAGAIINLVGTDLAGPLLGKAVGFAAKTVKNKRAAKALIDGLKAFDLTFNGGGMAAKSVPEPKPASVLDEVLGEPTPKPDANRAKEPWEMTREEFTQQMADEYGLSLPEDLPILPMWRWEEAVAKAYSEGKPVPKSVVDSMPITVDTPVIVSSPDGALQTRAVVRGVGEGRVMVFDGTASYFMPTDRVRIAQPNEVVFQLGESMNTYRPLQKVESNVDDAPQRGFTAMQDLPDELLTRDEFARNRESTVPYSPKTQKLKEAALAADKKAVENPKNELLGNKADAAWDRYNNARGGEIDDAHYQRVNAAIDAGADIPDEVINEYPELKRKYIKRKTAASGQAKKSTDASDTGHQAGQPNLQEGRQAGTPVKPPTSPVETPQPATATVEPPAQTVTPTTDPTTPTSARQATGLANVVQDAEADAGMIASSPRATGTKRGDAQAKGKAAVESGQIDPETLAAEIASGKRTFKDETEVGALMEGKRRLLQQAEDLGKKIDEAHARGEDATALIGQRDAIRTRLNTLIENVQVGKGKWSDVGRSLQEGTTIDEGNFENVLAEFRRNKPDGKVSDRESKALQDLVDQHNATKEQLAKVESELAQLKAAEGAQVIARKGTVGRRTVTQIRAERELVSASISKSIREAIGGPIGIGGGGLENLFEVVPQLARDLRKLIELYIEEFKVGKLDSEFYVGAKQVIRDALADVPDEVLDDLKVDLKNLSDDEVNRIFGGIYDVKQSRTKSEVQARISDLKKQAELLAKIEGAKEGEVLKAGTPPPPASPTVRELRAQLNELLKGLGADPSMDGVRTRLNNILDDLNKQSQGKYRNIKDNKTRVSPPDIQRIREQIASVRRDMRLEDTLADLEEQLATGNYKTRNKREIALTKQQIIMRDAVNEKRKIIRRKIAEASRGPFEKAMGVIDGAFSTLREGVATGDISFSGIQGSLALLTDTKAWANGTRASLKSYGSMGYDEIVKLIKSDADFDKIARTGVDLPAITSESEELFQNSVLQRVPVLGKGVKAAQRSYDGGATMTRYMMAKSHVALAESLNGGPLSDAAMKQIGDAVNSMTGRASSKLGKAVRTADFGRGIFAPSYWVSLFEAGYRPFTTAIDVGAKTGDWGPAKVYARKTARMYVGGVAVLGTTKMALESQTEWKVEIDPRSSLFGKAYKIKNGKVVSIDLLPPQLSQALKTISMQMFGKKDLAGDVDTSAYGRTAWIGQLLEGKAAPGPKMILSARDSMHVTNEKGTDAKPEDYPFGKNTDPRTGEGLKNLGLGSMPLTAQNVKEMIETDALSPIEKALLSPFVPFGRGPSIYPLGKTAKKKLGL